MAVMDGDRVMVIDEEHAGKAGHAVVVRTLDLNEEKRKKAKPKDRDKFPPRYLRVAGILESYTINTHGIPRVPSATAVTRCKEDISFFVKASSIHHHFLHQPRTLQLYNLVYITKCLPLAPHTIPDRSTGRVVDINTAVGIAEVVPSIEGADRHWYPIKILTLCFNLGDWVAIHRGPYNGRAGFILALRDGVANIYNVQAVRDNVFVVPTYNLIFGRPENSYLPPNNPDMPLDKLVGPASKDLQLATTALRSAISEDHKRRNSIAAKIHTGGFWKNKQVVIRGFQDTQTDAYGQTRKQSYNGQHGMIKGGTLKGLGGHKPALAEARQQGRDLKEVWGGATMQVQLEGSLVVTPVPIENLLDQRMLLPLIEAVWIPEGVDIPSRSPTPELDPADRQGEWAFTAEELIAPKERRRRQMEEAEHDGSWMCDPQLVGKHLDVMVDFSTRAPLNTMARTMKKTGGTVGYVILKQAPLRSKLMSTFLEPTLEGHVDRVFLSPCNLRPLRTMQKGNWRQTDSIMGHAMRAVIIAEDRYGNQAHIGEYTEIIPLKDPTKQDPLEVIVRFPCPNWHVKHPKGTYPLTSLCRAYNESIPGNESVQESCFE
ncbi:hypothetical protein FB451DRAFT_1180730 [Mycena latifolia]|nr:hypothetical protein FB451DRAFT_1180730 [Mycena latifolia]